MMAPAVVSHVFDQERVKHVLIPTVIFATIASVYRALTTSKVLVQIVEQQLLKVVESVHAQLHSADQELTKYEFQHVIHTVPHVPPVPLVTTPTVQRVMVLTLMVL